jgi:hypothetical protein
LPSTTPSIRFPKTCAAFHVPTTASQRKS